MLPREAADIDEQAVMPSGFELDDLEGEEPEDTIEADVNQRSTWRRACAAKRSIERMRERQHLKELLTDVFEEENEPRDYLDGSEED